MRLLQFAAGVMLALMLANCASAPNNPITESQVFTLENSYGVVQSAALAYTLLRPCAEGEALGLTAICKSQEVVAKLASADKKARGALDSLELFVRNNPKLDARALYDGAQLAIKAFRDLATSNKLAGV